MSALCVDSLTRKFKLKSERSGLEVAGVVRVVGAVDIVKKMGTREIKDIF